MLQRLGIRAMPLEKTITNSIIRYAKEAGLWHMKIHGGPYQTPGIPDLLIIKEGRAYFLEVKQPGKRPTKLQEQRMEDIRKRGKAVAEWVTSREQAEEVLNGLHHQPR